LSKSNLIVSTNKKARLNRGGHPFQILFEKRSGISPSRLGAGDDGDETWRRTC
jgi:hypothetical protein